MISREQNTTTNAKLCYKMSALKSKNWGLQSENLKRLVLAQVGVSLGKDVPVLKTARESKEPGVKGCWAKPRSLNTKGRSRTEGISRWDSFKDVSSLTDKRNSEGREELVPILFFLLIQTSACLEQAAQHSKPLLPQHLYQCHSDKMLLWKSWMRSSSFVPTLEYCRVQKTHQVIKSTQ